MIIAHVSFAGGVVGSACSDAKDHQRTRRKVKISGTIIQGERGKDKEAGKRET